MLIDPPFEEAGEHARMAEAFLAAHQVWPTGTFALWRPIKDPAEARALLDPIERAGIDKLINVDLLVRAPGDPKALSGSGLIVANPPWTLAEDLRAGLPELARALAQGPGACGSVETLTAV